MLRKILIGLAVALVAFAGFIASRPADFAVTRALAMRAAPEIAFNQVNDFRKWEAWSPWAKMDPDAKNTFEGPAAGEGAMFGWSGNKDVGEGGMTIVKSVPGESVAIKLYFVKPFKATNDTMFTFTPQGNETLVIWSMYGKNNFMAKAIGIFIDCDKMIGGQFEKGLASMKAIVEKGPDAREVRP